jgi:hypothetical protein
MIPDAALSQLKADNPCHAIAARMGVRLRKHGSKMVGPCPICSKDKQSRSAARFEADSEGFVCAVCREGGDVIKLVQLVEGQDFRGAVAWLGGPGEVDPIAAEKRARERAEEQAKRDAEAERYRQNERKTLHDIWNHAVRDIAGTPVDAYLRFRHLEPPPAVRLRYVAALPFYHGMQIGEGGRKHARVIHRGAAMIAPITDNAGIFRGLSQTWIDLSQPKGRPILADPDTGEILKARKFRGSTKAAHIDLLGPRLPGKIIIGEGIETVLTAWLALSKLGRDLTDTAFWTALDLGNFGGKAADKIGRLPGPTPDLAAPAIAVPPCVTEIVILGDGDSERVLTECALCRASARWSTDARQVRVAWAPAGRDFNDLLREAA